MFECRKVRGAMAASLYETLPEAERARLHAHVARCAACRQELDALTTLVRAIPRNEASFSGDLLPAIHLQWAEERRGGRMTAWRWAVSAALVALLGLAVGIGTRLEPGQSTPDPVKVVASPLEKMLAEARKAANSDFAAARAKVLKALSEHPGDPRAGDAQQFLAELEFGHGQRYREAFEAYKTLQTKFNATFAANPVSVFRLNVLDEARTADYQPLYALDAARTSAGDTLQQLEKVIARYPGTLVASLGVEAMADTVARAASSDGMTRAAALETLRNQCTDPTAAAQVTLALGAYYWQQQHDPEKARPIYAALADSQHAVMAQLARQALAEMDARSAAP